tara:strand:+ start:187 stop:735 length:549 start_codon:yes stop_codon:yes gene_type:complete
MTSFMHNSLAYESNALWVLARATFALRSFGRLQVYVLLFLIFPAILQATPIRVIDEAAIPFTGFLAKVDFDQRYSGELFDDPVKLDTGWYVIYQHETLNYYFGPILLESIGRDYLDQLSRIVQVAVTRRPSIQDYRLELSYEPSASSFDNNSNEPSTQNPLPPRALPKSSFWSFVKKVFGYR